VDLHPVLFGIYGGIVYHHGSSRFRAPFTRFDRSTWVHLPIPLRQLVALRRRTANTVTSRRMLRQIREDERFYLALTGEDPA
jgi:hypothetical protein